MCKPRNIRFDLMAPATRHFVHINTMFAEYCKTNPDVESVSLKCNLMVAVSNDYEMRIRHIKEWHLKAKNNKN